MMPPERDAWDPLGLDVLDAIERQRKRIAALRASAAARNA